MAGVDATGGPRQILPSGSQVRGQRFMYTANEIPNMKTKWTVLIQVIERRPAETSKSITNPRAYRNYWLTDMMGTKIPAIVFGDDVAFFERILLPYRRYYISNASVRPTKKEYQIGDYLYTWYLNSSTPIQPIMDDVPMKLPCIFHFTPFGEFGRDADKETDLTVKGLVLKSFPIKLSRRGLWSKDYILVNHEKKLVVLRTWKYGEEPVSIELQHSVQDPPLLIVEHVKVTTFSGISLSTKNTAMFLQDPPINEEVPLKQWYKDNSASIEQLLNARKFHDPSQFLELPQHADLIPVQMAMNSIDTLKACWVAGKIRLILGQRSFWFPSCPFCNRHMNAEPGWEQWCVPCQENMVVQYRCHFDVTLSDESGSLSADLYSPDAEMLLGCDALQLEEKNMPLPFLERTIKNAIADKHVVCFIKPYDRPVRGVNMRTFPIVKLYAFEDVYPPTKPVQTRDNAESSATGLDAVVSDCSLAKMKDDHGEFFTPTTKKVLAEVSQDLLHAAVAPQVTGLKRTLFPDGGASSGAAAAPTEPATQPAEKEMNASSGLDMEATTPVKKNRNKEKMH